ncbi:MAG: hypothetical protein DWQ56_14560 [Microcystis aeruginosa DA14]|uniref:Uncharacterized protein n=1 Tax=Microcystis aeruginosa DA14 TaxID=1987506 RepID=A0A3E0M7E4_MICAE|nr:MAG: hypothetical protein DWQ56_14560 [Microcystis aeruginosa DA14]
MGASHFCKSTKLGFLRGNSLLKSGITSDFITQSNFLGGSTLQTPRALAFRWDAYSQLLIHLQSFKSH